MYLYYQKLPGVTEFILSRDRRTNNAVFSGITPSMKKTVEFIIHTFKQIPIQNCIFDDKTKIWSIIGPSGDVILAHFQSFITQGIFKGVILEEITDSLQERLENGRLDRPLRKENEEIKFKEEEFFHNHSSLEDSLSRDEVIQRLANLIEMKPLEFTILTEQELKREYRRAALRLHPDRNNGDGSKMSELNMLWTIFNSGVKI